MALKEEFEQQGNWLFVYRSYIPLIAVAAGIITFIYTRSQPNFLVFNSVYYGSIYDLLCLLISLFGLAIRCYIVGYTPANTSGRNTKEGQVADTVNQTGMYSMVRHPLYFANWVMYLGVAMVTGNFWFIMTFIFAFWVYYERIMFAEEQFLTHKFGERYVEWSKTTPAFIPRLKNYKKPVLPFSWKKVIKQEKNGFAAVFIIFALFDLLNKFVSSKDFSDMRLQILTLIVIVIFIAITYLKRNTSCFDEEGR